MSLQENTLDLFSLLSHLYITGRSCVWIHEHKGFPQERKGFPGRQNVAAQALQSWFCSQDFKT